VENQLSVQNLEINLSVWFIDRMLHYKPAHFVITGTPLTEESAMWIIYNLSGRFSFIATNTYHVDDFTEIVYPAFEDKKEAMIYELKWS